MYNPEDDLFKYKQIHDSRIEVYSGAVMVGNIVKRGDKYQYLPSNSRRKTGFFKTLDDIKAFINGDDMA
jgi:hypothetical protein